MIKFALVIVIFFVSLFVYTKFVGPFPLSVTSTITTQTDTFSVSGEGKVITTPDIAVVNAGVQVNGPTVKQVQDELNSKINAISDAVDIAKEDIQTSNYSIYPQYDYRQSGARITGYQASSNLTIKVRNIDRVNEVIDAATAAGANQIGGISFDVDDKTRMQNEARKNAVADARRKAEDASRIAGFKLGRVVNYQESFGDNRPPIILEKVQIAPIGGEPTQVEPGSSEIVVTVSLSFQIL